MRVWMVATILTALGLVSLACAAPITARPGGQQWWKDRHAQYLKQAKAGEAGVLFLGDSITDLWRREGRQVWDAAFAKFKPLNFGIGGDRLHNLLWRVRNDELEHLNPKWVVVLIGTNNLPENTVDEIAVAHRELLAEIRARLPKSKILFFGIFPRADGVSSASKAKIPLINAKLAELADGQVIFYADIGEQFKTKDGRIPRDLMPDGLHLSLKGYQIWANALLPFFSLEI